MYMSADIEVIGIFGASLEDTLKHAGVLVGIFDENDEAYVFGSVPLVVAQCGVFLKEKGRFIPASALFYARKTLMLTGSSP